MKVYQQQVYRQEKMQDTDPGSKFKASREWLYRFLRRHKMSLRRATTTGQELPVNAKELILKFFEYITVKRASYEQIVDWVFKAWDSVPVDMIKKSYEKCVITTEDFDSYNDRLQQLKTSNNGSEPVNNPEEFTRNTDSEDDYESDFSL